MPLHWDSTNTVLNVLKESMQVKNICSERFIATAATERENVNKLHIPLVASLHGFANISVHPLFYLFITLLDHDT